MFREGASRQKGEPFGSPFLLALLCQALMMTLVDVS